MPTIEQADQKFSFSFAQKQIQGPCSECVTKRFPLHFVVDSNGIPKCHSPNSSIVQLNDFIITKYNYVDWLSSQLPAMLPFLIKYSSNQQQPAALQLSLFCVFSKPTGSSLRPQSYQDMVQNIGEPIRWVVYIAFRQIIQ
jgi:hypothetical protein